MERGHVVVFRQAGSLAVDRGRIGARLEHEHRHSRFGETRCERAAARPGADHDIVERVGRRPRHRQNVLMNSIKARLSSSLSGDSWPNVFSSPLRSLGVVEFGRAEIMAAIDDEIRTFEELQERPAQLGEPGEHLRVVRAQIETRPVGLERSQEACNKFAACADP